MSDGDSDFDVDLDLRTIESKYDTDLEVFELPDNVRSKILKLNDEFQSIRLPKVNCKSNIMINVFDQLISNIHILVNMYRRAIRPPDSNNKRSQGDMSWLMYEKYESELNETKKMISNLEDKLKMFALKYDALEKENKSLKADLKKNKKFHVDNIDQFLHKIKHLERQNEVLKEKCGDMVGKHTSSNDTVIKLLNKHKLNEEVLQKAVRKLQDTNQELLKELVDLKYK